MKNNQVANENPSTTTKRKIINKASHTKALYSVIVLLVLIAGASSWFIYHRQHQQVEKLTTSLNDASQKASISKTALLNEIKGNSKTTADLQKKYQDALDKLNAATMKKTTLAAQPTQQDLDLIVDKAATANADSAGYIFGVIAVNLILKNNTDSTIALSPTAYTLRDVSNHVYTAMFSSQTGFGKNFIPLQVSQLEPGQTVTGYIGLQIADPSVTDYSLIVGSHIYPVSATKLASFPVAD